MRFYPHGSGSYIAYVISSSRSDYSVTSTHAFRAANTVWALSGSKGPTGDTGVAGSISGSYDTYPPVCS